MDVREQWDRHRKDNKLIVGLLAALFFVFAVIYFLLQRGKGLPAQIAGNKVLLFALWYLNIVLILTILLILIRSAFRLWLERRHRVIGSKFKTKLVVTAVGLSLIPVLIIFPFATRLIRDSFDSWFSLPLEEVLQQANTTAQFLADEIERNNTRTACLALDQVIGFDLSDLGQQPTLLNLIQRLRSELDVDYLVVFDGLEQIHGTANLARGFNRVPDLRGQSRLLEEALAKGKAAHRVEEELGLDGTLILAACAGERRLTPAEDAARPGSALPRTVVVAGRVLPADIAQKSDAVRLAYQRYLQTLVNRTQVRSAYLQNLLLVTLLVVLAFASIGLRLARRITAPIQSLVDATRQIRAGDLQHRIEVAVDDELGVLVESFNTMIEELRRNKELVDERSRELRVAHKRLATVLQNVAAGVLAIKSDGEILTCNGAALAILSQREEEVVGRSLREAWADPERGKLIALLDEDFTAGGQIRRQMQLLIAGVWKTLEVKVTSLPDPGTPGGRVVVLEDLTELIHAQRMATWNEVARRIAHEIKNPLTPIQLTAERLLRRFQAGDAKFGETLEQGTQVIVREVDSLKSMVDEFSRFARMPRPQPRQIEVDKLFAELANLHRGIKPGIEVVATVEPGAETVRFDAGQLRSVLINLIDNAMEATDAPGKITLRSRRTARSALLEVADTGRGIAAEDKERVFLPYFSTKGRGSGLGLSIVHRIVNDHQAQIHVADNDPHGAIFVLEIPLD
jgi:two-component system nitrogen regulation sensor histidine kinase NtrY